MKVLHIATELAPFAKTGGLGDVVAALPVAQAKRGVDVTVALPAYGHIDWAAQSLIRVAHALPVALGGETHTVDVLELWMDGVRVWLIDHPAFGWRHGVYGDAFGEYGDNPWRFALYGKAALAAAEALGQWPDVLHGHDWHTGATMVHAKLSGLQPPRRVFTIHNLAYRGVVPPDFVDALSLPWDAFTPDGFEFWGELCLLKAGLWAADVITAVSPRYAHEIQTPFFGEGLDGFLRERSQRLHGIVNGVDYSVWHPAHDAQLVQAYDAADLRGKAACKAALQHELGLPVDAGAPLFAVVSRLTGQKGIDLLVDALPALADARLQLVVVGAGDKTLLPRLEAARPSEVVTRYGVDEALAHRVYAAADFFVMPSRFEPCGLGQLYAMAYGALPIVSPVGGLLDTVVDATATNGTGFVLGDVSSDALAKGMHRALDAFAAPHEMARLRQNAMARRFDWTDSAAQYDALYRA